MPYSYSTQGYNIDSAGQRIVIDPITRIEGHLRCEVNINSDNIITNAVSSGTLFRGLEIILKGRDPRDAWAFAQRICGVCTGTHALASIQAVEDALDIKIPDNANIIRNIMQLTLWYHDHLVHFYHLAGLDWVDVMSAAKADPKATSALAQSLSPWENSSPGYFKEVQNKLLALVATGNLGIFTNGYWGHPAYKLPPEGNLMVLAHYLEALDFQKDAVKIHTVFGGKNPHPNWLVGGVPCSLNIDGTGGADVINNERLELVKQLITRCQTFSKQVLMPDAMALGLFYKDWFNIGKGISGQSLLAYGSFPQFANDYSSKSLLIPRGAIINGNFNEVHEVNLFDPEQIQEEVSHAWYKYPKGVNSLHPFAGETDPEFKLGANTKGSKQHIKELDETAKYSWIKTPRWRGNMMEVGPLARTLVSYALKDPEVTEWCDSTCKTLDIPITGLQSTLGRILARCREAVWAADKMEFFYDKLINNLKNGITSTANTQKWEPDTWKNSAKGVGFCEAPRGALGHWVTIKNKYIESYQAIVPTTWNSAARSGDDQISAYESALMDTHLDIPEQPLEVLRTVHSFDPCLACATHIIGPEGNELISVKVDGLWQQS